MKIDVTKVAEKTSVSEQKVYIACGLPFPGENDLRKKIKEATSLQGLHEIYTGTPLHSNVRKEAHDKLTEMIRGKFAEATNLEEALTLLSYAPSGSDVEREAVAKAITVAEMTTDYLDILDVIDIGSPEDDLILKLAFCVATDADDYYKIINHAPQDSPAEMLAIKRYAAFFQIEGAAGKS